MTDTHRQRVLPTPLEADALMKSGRPVRVIAVQSINPVSYTHLTLPTICSV